MFADTGPADIWVAVVGLTGVIAAIVLPWILAGRRAKQAADNAAASVRDVADALGAPNGHGSLVAMVEKVLDGQRKTADWQASHDSRDDDRFSSVNRRLDHVEDRLTRLDPPPRRRVTDLD